MSSIAPVVRPGARIGLHLQILLPDGTEALSTFGEDPLELTLGDGTLVPGLERLLIGLEVDADMSFLADGSELYGPRDEEKIYWLPRAGIPAGLDLAPGQVVAFDAPGGQETAGVVLAIDADRVRVDFNHPLSGRSIQVRAHILFVA